MNRWTIECICTDRGQHKRTWLARMIWTAPFEPTPEQREEYRRALEANDPIRGANEHAPPLDVEGHVQRMGEGGWHTFLPGGSTQGPEHKHWLFSPPLHYAEPGGGVSRRSYGFACSRCSRTSQIRGPRWSELLDAARLNQMREFDVSYLD